ncbi:hypothetical protein PV327_011167 [Microctonus hyperodae]|uniref:Uncharacterized protein n=1 Tax=Microctonus hyperodae TaxID=165561 RepID=A0AA39EYX8_MICHY|nr:hypothetical protein PV327_011167 [Microctonus hyperodae]
MEQLDKCRLYNKNTTIVPLIVWNIFTKKMFFELYDKTNNLIGIEREKKPTEYRFVDENFKRKDKLTVEHIITDSKLQLMFNNNIILTPIDNMDALSIKLTPSCQLTRKKRCVKEKDIFPITYGEYVHSLDSAATKIISNHNNELMPNSW